MDADLEFELDKEYTLTMRQIIELMVMSMKGVSGDSPDVLGEFGFAAKESLQKSIPEIKAIIKEGTIFAK